MTNMRGFAAFRVLGACLVMLVAQGQSRSQRHVTVIISLHTEISVFAGVTRDISFYEEEVSLRKVKTYIAPSITDDMTRTGARVCSSRRAANESPPSASSIL